MGRRIMGGEDNLREQAKARSLTRRDFLVAGAGAGLFVFGLGGLGGPVGSEAQAAPSDLDIFSKGFPRAFFGRVAEEEARSGKFTYEQWEKRYLPLDGIVGKVLNEENYYTGMNNLPFFLGYKAAHPEKMVLLHYNGTGRRATDDATTKFFAGHWLYYRGTKLTQAVTNRTQNVLHVEVPSVFSMKRYRRGVADDIAIAQMGTDGRPNWSTAEHVRLEAINRRNKTITVQRGKYGTRRNTFPKGSYLAAHVTTGPYRYNSDPQNGVPLWAYNFSTECPRDGQGRNCGDALAEYLGEKLGPNGELASFDGLVFDVFSWVIRFGDPIQEIDVNTDGRADRGVLGGVNTVSKGALDFLRKLREQLGPDKLILSDGHIPRESQRGFGYLNGVETEGYPDKYDFRLDHLSRGENIFSYWKANSSDPPLNYANFRYKQDKPERWRNTFTGDTLVEDKSYQKLRLALASACFTDSAFTSGGQWLPPEVLWETGGVQVKVFDELWKGTEQVPYWLGQPLGPAVHLAESAPDLLGGQGESWPDSFVGRFAGDGVSFSRGGTETAPTLVVRNTRSERPPGMSFTLTGIEVPDKDLFVSLRLKAGPLEGFPSSVPRRVDVSAIPDGGVVTPPNKEFSWAGSKPFDASFYYQDVGPGTVHLHFDVQGEQPLTFISMVAYSAQDKRYREYERGVVFANPSTRPCTFDVGALFKDLLDSGVTLKRIQRSADQDPIDRVNDGNLLGQQLTLPAKDALFVEKVQPPAG